jgi:hypothetical protein
MEERSSEIDSRFLINTIAPSPIESIIRYRIHKSLSLEAIRSQLNPFNAPFPISISG